MREIVMVSSLYLLGNTLDALGKGRVGGARCRAQ
jgi:hypothetical protein